MKKFLATMLLAVTLIFIGGQDNQAEAYRQHVGNYQDNGDAAYLLTETLAGGRSNFSCDVVTSRGQYIHYQFYYRGGRPYYTNSWGLYCTWLFKYDGAKSNQFRPSSTCFKT